MTTTLYAAAAVHAHAHADAIAVRDGVITWIGKRADAGAAEPTVELGSGWIAPAFVDGHVHTTQSGLMLDGLDLHAATSRDDLLDRYATYARSRSGQLVLGTGWDESHWPYPVPPTLLELDRAAPGVHAYLARADVHSALVSPALLTMVDVGPYTTQIRDAWVRLDAHHAVRRHALRSIGPAQTLAAQRRFLCYAASRGVARVDEMAGPDISNRDDLAALLDLARDVGVEVLGCWGELGDVQTPIDLGVPIAGGDLFCDGSIGSRTAAFYSDYDDDPSNRGALRFDTDQIAEHIVAAAHAGLATDFHVIGDEAIDQVLDAHELAARAVTLPAGSRLEHIEAASHDAIRRIAALGLTASMQPLFDDEWGGPDRMYAQRLGARAHGLNAFRAFLDAGVPLLFGSDSPVCGLDPWAGVRAAARHRTPESSVPVDVAFDAHTLGPLAVGAPATFAVWTADGRVDLDHPPTCLRTVVAGRMIHDADGDV